MISNSGHDENGRYSGGAAGDNNGKEWAIINWYNRPWNCMLRHPNPNVRHLIKELAVQAANNDNIGYDQSNRKSFWKALEKSGYYPENIKDKCEADCSAGVAAIVKAVGFLLDDDKLKGVSPDAYTGNLKQVLTKAGFTAYTESKYLGSDAYLLEGDVLLYSGHHTCINVTNVDSTSDDGWKQEDNTWRYYRNGEPIKKEWVLYKHYWYRLGNNGEMLTGEHKIVDEDGNLSICLFDSDGRLLHEREDHKGYLEAWYIV